MQNFKVCIDANLALKLVLAEDDSPRALALWRRWIETETLIVAPPLLAYEVTSVLRGKVHRGLLTAAAGDKAFALIHAQGIEYLAPPALHRRAWELAKRFQRPAAYDAHYLALAEMLACPLWTADERLYNTVKEQLSWVRWLGEPKALGYDKLQTRTNVSRRDQTSSLARRASLAALLGLGFIPT